MSTNVEGQFVSPNDAKPNVVGSVVEVDTPLPYCPKCNSSDIQQHTKGEDICKSCGHVWDIYRPYVGLS
jgi:ribosomal protein L37AE/L43A